MRNFLSDCEPESAFWSTNGVVCRNLNELLLCIKGLNESDFRYHVNQDNKKNDFAKWILEVIGDEVLARALSAVLDKDLYADIIEQRMKHLESDYKAY